MNGISFELRDQFVDKLLLKKGYKEAEIFYSPIACWFVFLLFTITFSIPLFIYVIYIILTEIPFTESLIYVLIYFLLGYLLIAIFNKSFAVTKNELLIINAQFPFCKIRSYQFEEIKEVRISSSPLLSKLGFIFAIKGNFLQIKTRFSKRRYYCFFLDVDCFDENWTEKTLDDLHHKLMEKKVLVKFELD